MSNLKKILIYMAAILILGDTNVFGEECPQDADGYSSEEFKAESVLRAENDGIDFETDKNKIVLSGSCGENANYEMDINGHMTISGTGEISGINIKSLEGYDEVSRQYYNVKTIKIEPGINKIGDNCFSYGYYARDKIRFQIPDTVEEIGKQAFSELKMKDISIPASVKKLGTEAFQESSLEQIQLSQGLELIGWGCFDRCTELTEISIPDGCRVGANAFRSCIKLKKVSFSDVSGDYDYDNGGCFVGCISLESVEVKGESTKYIPREAFLGCSALKVIIIPDTVEIIGEGAFSGCKNLEKVVFPEKGYKMDSGAFNDCSKLKEIDLTSYEGKYYSKFYNENWGIDWWDISEVDSNGSVSFSGASTRFIFSGSTEIEKIKINQLSDNTWSSLIENTNSIGSFGVYGTGLDFEYKTSSMEMIPESLFANSRHLKRIDIPDGVKEIRKEAFKDCEGLTEVRIPSTLTEIGDNAFSGCSNLKKIVLPKGVCKLGKACFSMCKNLEDVNIPDLITEIPYDCFKNCENLVNVVIPDNVTVIGAGAFAGCISIESIRLSENVTSVGTAFLGCDKLKSIRIENCNCDFGSLSTIKSENTKLRWTINGELTVYGYTNSTAEDLAKASGLKFESIGAAEVIKLLCNKGWFEEGEDEKGRDIKTTEKNIYALKGRRMGKMPIPDRYYGDDDNYTEYYFEGWFTEKAGGNLITPDYVYGEPEEFQNLYAHWSGPIGDETLVSGNTITIVGGEKTARIIIDAKTDDGMSVSVNVSAAIYKKGKKIKLNKLSDVAGFSFAGYYCDGKKINSIREKNLTDMTLVARYIENEYKIIYKIPKPARGVQYTGKPKLRKVKYTDEVILDGSSISADGYLFLGWTNKKDSTEIKYKPDEKVSGLCKAKRGKIILYGIWAN